MVHFLHSSEFRLGRIRSFRAQDARAGFPPGAGRARHALRSSDPGGPERMRCIIFQLAAQEPRVIVLLRSPERFPRPGEVRVLDLP